jgi:hypothetical protein
MFQTIAGPRSRPPADRLGGEAAAQPPCGMSERSERCPCRGARPRPGGDTRPLAGSVSVRANLLCRLNLAYVMRPPPAGGGLNAVCGVRFVGDYGTTSKASCWRWRKRFPGRRRPRSAARQDPALRLTWRVPVIRFAWAPSWSDREASQSVRAEGEGRCHET